jgi:3-mercaptopyruvate sulfurtransferase SseA
VAHIPGALFFDLDGIVDRTTDVRIVSRYTLHPQLI